MPKSLLFVGSPGNPLPHSEWHFFSCMISLWESIDNDMILCGQLILLESSTTSLIISRCFLSFKLWEGILQYIAAKVTRDIGSLVEENDPMVKRVIMSKRRNLWPTYRPPPMYHYFALHRHHFSVLLSYTSLVYSPWQCWSFWALQTGYTSRNWHYLYRQPICAQTALTRLFTEYNNLAWTEDLISPVFLQG